MRKSRISEVMQNIHPKFIDEANEYVRAKTSARPVWLKWGMFTACLCLVIAAVFAAELFWGFNQIAVLDNGDEIRFVKVNGALAQRDSAVRTRKLTDDEIVEMFGDLPIAGYALFDEKDGRVLGIEGSYGDMKLLISVPGIDIRDTVIVGADTASEVYGVSVHAGYFISGKTVIYYVDFQLGESTVYIENAGNKDGSENVRKELASAVQSLILLENIDMTRIAK